MSSSSKKSGKKSNKTGHFENKYWVWPSGLRTHVLILQQCMMRGNPLPPGFYEAAKKCDNKSIQRMGVVAKDKKIKELKNV